MKKLDIPTLERGIGSKVRVSVRRVAGGRDTELAEILGVTGGEVRA